MVRGSNLWRHKGHEPSTVALTDWTMNSLHGASWYICEIACISTPTPPQLNPRNQSTNHRNSESCKPCLWPFDKPREGPLINYWLGTDTHDWVVYKINIWFYPARKLIQLLQWIVLALNIVNVINAWSFEVI